VGLLPEQMAGFRRSDIEKLDRYVEARFRALQEGEG
jgi:hypothetical protein